MVKKFKIKKRESLYFLTTKFIDYVYNHLNTLKINLKKIPKELNIKKRRLYDLTNVLEGIEYLKKYSRNIMIITAKFYQQILILKTNEIIKLKIKQMEEKSKNEERDDNKIENIIKKENENAISEVQFMKSDYNFEIKEKKEIKIAIGEEMNDINLSFQKFQPVNINDKIFEEAFNQIFKRNYND